MVTTRMYIIIITIHFIYRRLSGDSRTPYINETQITNHKTQKQDVQDQNNSQWTIYTIGKHKRGEVLDCGRIAVKIRVRRQL